MKSGISILFALLASSSQASGIDSNYTGNAIKVAGCPANLTLFLPSDFRKPKTIHEIKIHDKILDDLHSNKSRKTVYSNIFLIDWSSVIPFPQVATGSLGSLSGIQGNVTQNNWIEIKDTLLSASTQQVTKISTDAGNKLEEQFDINFKNIQMNKPFAVDRNSIASIGIVSAEAQGIPMYFYSSMKMIYVKNCIVYMNVSVETKEKYSREYFLSLIQNITVK